MSVPSVGKEEPNCLIVLCLLKFGSSLPTEGTLMSYCAVFCDVRFLFTYRRNAHVLLFCAPSVGKEEPNFTKHSTIRHERSFCR
jgi:hypothetical protein